jgi:hypothetical protein
MFPEEWTLYEEAIPKEERDDFIKAYGRRLRGDLGDEGKPNLNIIRRYNP